jgi:hypothetical protein
MQSQLMSAKSGGSSRAPLGCLMLFGLPFVAGGLLALREGVREYGTKPDAIVPIIVGGVFTTVGLLVILGAWYGTAASTRQEALKTQNPGQPWMWREDWARGFAKDSTRGTAIALWVFTILWNAVSFPAAFLVFRPEVLKENRLVLFVLLFPLVGVGMLVAAIYQTLQSMKFGTSICHLGGVPIVPGRVFRGEIELHNEGAPANGYRLRLSCVRSVTTRTGKNRSTNETVLWDEEIVVEASAAMRSPVATRVPFELATPPDSQPTDEHDSYDRTFWRLTASAELPGVDYGAQFELPVFQTGEKVDGHEFAAHEQHHRAEAAHREFAPTSGVEITGLPGGGEEFRIHARKTVGAVVKSLVFLGIWNAGIVAMIHFHAPWGFPAVFIALDLLFIVSSIDHLFGRSIISVDKSGVRVQRQWPGMSSTKAYEAATIESIDGITAGQSGSSFGITMKLRDGNTNALAGYLPDRESADAVAAKMMADLGRVESR